MVILSIGIDSSKVFTGIVQGYIDGQTSRVWGKPRVAYPTIQSVIDDPKAEKKETVVDKIKWGQLSGTIKLATSGLLYWFSSKLDSGFWKGLLLFGSASSAIGGLMSWVVGSFCTNGVEKQMQEVLEKYIDKRIPTTGGLEKVGLSKTNRSQFGDAAEKARTEGVVLNVYGPSGTGKTMAAEHFATELVNKGVCEKAVFWDAKREVLSYGLTDVFRRLLGSLIPGESVEQRLERAVANAFAHHKKTGEHVVLVLNEAELLLEGEGAKMGETRKRSKVDPKDRPELVQKFADIVDKVKRECKGVSLILTANTLENSFAFLERRFTTGRSIVIERPDAEVRKEIIGITVEAAKKQDSSLSISLTEQELDDMSKIGTIDLLTKMKNKHYYESLGKWKTSYEFLANFESFMKDFNVLNGQEVRDAVLDAIREKKNGSSKGFKDILEDHLTQRVSRLEMQASTWEDELKQRAGKSTDDWYWD